ncbi:MULTISPECIES: DUF4199 domain-containing protein [unclassified Ekhidna]|jgi:tetrahydromethanopterin S-methyltransferase subunit G|uniref:DUF4199 domain-containing protein n=1 Tax=unclassified Ekhidna TaxID=2632188 RepID=UPI0032DFE4C7
MNNHAIKSGLMVGVIGIVLTLLLYIVNAALLVSMWMLLFFIVFLALVCYFGIQHRNEIGGYMSFGKAWVYSMQVFIAAGLLSTIFNLLLYNVIDPELPEMLADQSVENAESMMRNFGMPEDQMDEALEKTRSDTLDRFTVSGSVMGFLWGLIIYAILSLITGAIIKKKEPELEG